MPMHLGHSIESLTSLDRRNDTIAGSADIRSDPKDFGSWRNVNSKEAFIVEGWSQGFMFGALMIMAIITVVNMKRHVLLHKLILLELLLAMSHGTFCFMSFKGYGWYLSGTAAFLYISYYVHNIVAWLKVRSFFNGRSIAGPKVSKIVSITYVSTLALAAIPIIFQIFNNFRYFNNISTLYAKVRPYEPLFRDPWWVFSCLVFFYAIRTTFNLRTWNLMKRSPRFAILLASICLALCFTVVDVISTLVSSLSETDGINPYWKIGLVFKCLSDNIMLDDFKSVLMRLGALKLDGDGRELRTDIISDHAQRRGDDVYYNSDYSLPGDPLQSEDSGQRWRRPHLVCPHETCYSRSSPRQGAQLLETHTATPAAEKAVRASYDSCSRLSAEGIAEVPFGLDRSMVNVGVLPGISDFNRYGSPSKSNATSHLTQIRPLPSIMGEAVLPSDLNRKAGGRPSDNFTARAGPTMKFPGLDEIGFPLEKTWTNSRSHANTLTEPSSSISSEADVRLPWEKVEFAATTFPSLDRSRHRDHDRDAETLVSGQRLSTVTNGFDDDIENQQGENVILRPNSQGRRTSGARSDLGGS